ncbi:hypothetical protein JTE90_014771, partial [Oedothorax gibbosus]
TRSNRYIKVLYGNIDEVEKDQYPYTACKRVCLGD